MKNAVGRAGQILVCALIGLMIGAMLLASPMLVLGSFVLGLSQD